MFAEPAPVAILTPSADLVPVGHDPRDYARVRVPLTALVTNHDVMWAVIVGGTPSDTPGEPLLLNRAPGITGRYEIADGHHRVAEALRAGQTHLWGDIDLYYDIDDEPYLGPYFDFTADLTATLTADLASRGQERVSR